ncbi:MAG: hypothetical protein J0H08_06635 [Rhizobiales bacterium]|nr:hypothetical protein [Hyphomicrobiales bacterium]
MIYRLFNLFVVLAMIAAAVITYNLKHDTEAAATRVARLNSTIAREREAIALLKAEWSTLSQPGRLQQLVTRYDEYFQLEPFSAAQVATLDEIPLRAVQPEESLDDAAMAAARGLPDPIVTGTPN